MIISYIRHFLGAIWSILCISSSLIFMVIFFNRKLPIWMARRIWAPGMCFIYGANIDVSGLENIDRSKPYIYIANHQSFLDIPVLFYALQVNFYFVAKEELKKMPFLGWYMIATGMIFVDRGDRRKAIISMKKAASLIEGGKNVIMFPEGTRTRDGQIRSFKKGTFHLSSMTNVDIIPVKLDGTGKVWDPNNQKVKSGKVKVVVGKPIDTSNLNGNTMNEFIDKTRTNLIELF